MALLPWSLAPTESADAIRTGSRDLFRAAAQNETSPKEAWRSAAIVWCCIALFAGIDAVWLAVSSLQFHPFNWPILASFTAVAIVGQAAALRLARRADKGRPDTTVHVLARKFSLLGRGGLMLLLLVAGFIVFSYLATAASPRLHDALMADLDSRLGFDWIFFLAIANAEPRVAAALSFSYHSAGVTLLAAVAWLAVSEQEVRLRELLAALSLTFAGLAIGMVAVPTAGAFAHFTPPPPLFSNFPDAGHMWPFYRTFAALRDGSLRVIDFTAADGIVSFPSFHAALGLVVLWSLRGNRLLFWPALLLTAVMLVAVLPVGGHHLCELLGGVLIGFVAIGLVRRLC